jgi:phage FluMu gp28-like protein
VAAALDLYRRLPDHEYQALVAWLSTFYPFQQEWLLETAPHAICNKARQIGLSHTSSAVAVLWGVFHGELTTIISIGERESAEVLDKAVKHAQVLQRLGSRMAEMVSQNAEQLRFASSGRVMALPSTGGRSFTGNVFLDEYAYQPHAGAVWGAAAAVTTLGGRLRVASTPNGVGNEFEQLWTIAGGKESGWQRYEIDIDRAIADGYPLDLGKCWTIAKNDARIFDQLFRCKFLDGEQQYIPTDLLELAHRAPPVEDGECYGGLDIGESRDRTVLTIVRKSGPRRGVVHIESHKRTDDALLDMLVAKAFGAPYNCRKVCADATGLGSMPSKRFAQRYGIRFEPVVFTSESKEDLATGLYAVAAANELHLPRTYRAGGEDEGAALREDICAIRRILTTAGNVRYDAARTDAGHADRAWSLMLGLHACATPPAPRGHVDSAVARFLG